MDREMIIASLAVHLADKRCKGTSAEELVSAYFEVLPEIRKCYDEQEKQNTKPAKSTFLSRKDLNL